MPRCRPQLGCGGCSACCRPARAAGARAHARTRGRTHHANLGPWEHADRRVCAGLGGDVPGLGGRTPGILQVLSDDRPRADGRRAERARAGPVCMQAARPPAHRAATPSARTCRPRPQRHGPAPVQGSMKSKQAASSNQHAEPRRPAPKTPRITRADDEHNVPPPRPCSHASANCAFIPQRTTRCRRHTPCPPTAPAPLPRTGQLPSPAPACQ